MDVSPSNRTGSVRTGDRPVTPNAPSAPDNGRDARCGGSADHGPATHAHAWTTAQLAELLGAELVGRGDIPVTHLDSLDRGDDSTLAFIRDSKYAAAWGRSLAVAAVVTRGLEPFGHDESQRALLIVDDADRALITLLEIIAPAHVSPGCGVAPSASIDTTASLGEGVRIGPGVAVGAGSRIGAGTILHANVVIGAGVSIGSSCDIRAGVVIEDRCMLGDGVIIHPNAVIGGDGFGYRPAPNGRGLLKIPHAGAVEIHDGVEIGAGTTIDRGKFGNTVIGAGAKIDNLVQIAHNCQIGRACVICGSCGIAGSVTIGDGAILGGGVGVKDNLTIGAGAQVGARAALMDNIPDGEVWVGYPARPAKETMRILAATARLPKLIQALRARGIEAEDGGASAPSVER